MPKFLTELARVRWPSFPLKRAVSPRRFQGQTRSFRIGRVIFFVVDRIKSSRRNIREFLIDPSTGFRLARYRAAIRRRDWRAALRQVNAIAAEAKRRRNPRLLEQMGFAMLRLGEYASAAQLRLESRQARNIFPANEWRGEDLSNRVLLIQLTEDNAQSLGTTRLVGDALAIAKRCIVLAEPRLVSLVQRSFPAADVRPAGEEASMAWEEADVFATAHHLAAHFWRDTKVVESSFRPLSPDPTLRDAFRSKYRRINNKPLVGISWGSAAYAKDLPPIDEWTGLLRCVDATFVSLQYGQISSDLEKLRQGHSHTIIHDESVDQLVDMDRFAAQIATLDAVVTISNTGAHLTGALGVPAVVIIDDTFRRIWPVVGSRFAWYPHATIVSKRGRQWNEVMSEARDQLSELLTHRQSSRGLAECVAPSAPGDAWRQSSPLPKRCRAQASP